jgi:hypothetical protein
MSNPDTLSLLREALEFLNDRPSFGLRRDRGATSYALASRIDAHIAGLPAQDTEHPAVAVSRQQYRDDDRISIDEPEYHVSESEACERGSALIAPRFPTSRLLSQRPIGALSMRSPLCPATSSCSCA